METDSGARWSIDGISQYGPWVILDLTGSDLMRTVERMIPLAEGIDNYIQWRAEDVAGTGLTDSQHFQVRIDTNPPVFDVFSPTEIQTVHEFTVSLHVVDSGGSGIALDDVHWRIGSGEWQDIDALSENTASAMLSVTGDGKYIITFRARDVAGNTNTSMEFNVAVDTSPPELLGSNPPSGEYIIGTSRNVTVRFRDDISGVNRSSLVYSERRGAGAKWGQWHPISNVTETAGIVTCSVLLDLHPGHQNWVRFRVTDMAGNGPAETGAIHLPVDTPPIARISSPNADEAFYNDLKIHFDSSGSSDMEGTFTVEWYDNGERMGRTDLSFHARLPEGNHTIVLVVIDEAGQRSQTEVNILVQTTDKDTWSSNWWVVAVILVVITASSLFLYNRRRPLQD